MLTRIIFKVQTEANWGRLVDLFRTGKIGFGITLQQDFYELVIVSKKTPSLYNSFRNNLVKG